MAFTLEQKIALEEAISQGALRVKYADKEVEYRSLSEMMALLGKMEEQLGTTRVRRRLFAKYRSGL